MTIHLKTADKIQYHRRKQMLSKRKLAELIGTTESQITCIEEGYMQSIKGKIEEAVLIALAKALKVDICELQPSEINIDLSKSISDRNLCNYLDEKLENAIIIDKYEARKISSLVGKVMSEIPLINNTISNAIKINETKPPPSIELSIDEYAELMALKKAPQPDSDKTGKMKTADKIRFYRKKRMLTQRKLGELSDLSEQMIRNYENDISIPKTANMQKIALALGVALTDLLADTISSPTLGLPSSVGQDK